MSDGLPDGYSIDGEASASRAGAAPTPSVAFKAPVLTRQPPGADPPPGYSIDAPPRADAAPAPDLTRPAGILGNLTRLGRGVVTSASGQTLGGLRDIGDNVAAKAGVTPDVADNVASAADSIHLPLPGALALGLNLIRPAGTPEIKSYADALKFRNTAPEALERRGQDIVASTSPDFQAATSKGLTEPGGFTGTNVAAKAFESVAGMAPPLVGTLAAGAINPAAGVGAGALLFGAQGERAGKEEGAAQVAGLIDEQLAAVPRYQELLASGLAPDKAREQLSTEVADQRARVGGTIGAGLGLVGQLPGVGPLSRAAASLVVKPAARVVGPTLARPLARIIGDATAEGAGFAGLNAASQAAQNATNPIPTPTGEGVLEAAAGGVLPGALLGAGRRILPTLYPGARPGSLSDAANAVHEATQPAAETQPAAPEPAPRVAPTQGEQAPARETIQAVPEDGAGQTTSSVPPSVPWIDSETGAVRSPTLGELKEQFHRAFEQASQEGLGPGIVNANARLAKEWGVDRQLLQRARNQAWAERKAGFRPGDVAPEQGQLESEQTQTSQLASSPDDQASGEDTKGGDTEATVPVMITQAMKRDLLAAGYDDAQIRKLTPQEAHAALRESANQDQLLGTVRAQESDKGSTNASLTDDALPPGYVIDGATAEPGAGEGVLPDASRARAREDQVAAENVARSTTPELRQPVAPLRGVDPAIASAHVEPGLPEGYAVDKYDAAQRDDEQRGAASGSDADRFPTVDKIGPIAVGPGAIRPRVIAPGQRLHRETNVAGLDDLLRTDGQPDIWRGFVTDDPDLAIGQGDNRGVKVTFRPNSVSGEVHNKPGTGIIGGREYQADVVAPRAVERITFENAKALKRARGITQRVLAAEFERADNSDGSIQFTRNGLSGGVVEAAARESAAHPENERPEPTPAQHEAGNFKAGHVDLHGLDVTLQVPKGAMRRGTTAEGEPWERAASDHYGHIKRTVGADHEPVDVYLGPHAEDPTAKVFVVDQNKPGTSNFDEHKAMVGYPDAAAARASYEANFPEDLKTFGGIREMSIDQFKDWVKSGDTAKPARLAKIETRAAGERRDSTGSARHSAAITDVGEKIGGARKDNAVATGPRGTADATDERPTWAKRYSISQIAKSAKPGEEGRWSIHDERQDRPATRETFATKEDAERALPLLAVARNHRVVSRTGEDGTKHEIVRDVTDRKRVRVVDQQFDSHDEAMRYMAQHAADIIETKKNFGEEILAKPDTVNRSGAPRRTGDVSGNHFRDTFGFRGVEFGNWNNQAERQQVMNHAYDGLHDLAELLNIPAKAISLNGDLALAFGARGQGIHGARAHYERNYGVINLTKMDGAGALAHEWFHALDHYLGRVSGKAARERETNASGNKVFKSKGPEGDYQSSGDARKSEMRAELSQAYETLMDTMFAKAEHYVEDTTQAQKFVQRTHDNLAGKLQEIRDHIGKERQYGAKKGVATAEQLAEFDSLAAKLMEGPQDFSHRYTGKPGVPAVSRGAMANRFTNDTLERMSAIFKAATGRSGFSAERSGVFDSVRAIATNHAERLRMLESAAKAETKTKKVPTSYAMESKKIDQGRASDYWTTPHEMAARAFSAYVEDKVAAAGNRSDFLSFGSDNQRPEYRMLGVKPFPEGREREALDVAFDKFFKTIETKETDKGTALFRHGGEVRDDHHDSIERAVGNVVRHWGANAPDVRVVRTPEDLPASAKRDPRYRNAKGVYDPKDEVAYIVASTHPDTDEALRTLAHEAIGHYGVDKIIDQHVKGGWARLTADVERLRANPEKAAPGIRNAMESVERRYRNSDGSPASRDTFARELVAVMAERGQRNALVERVIAAVRAFVRKAFPNMRLSESEIAGLLKRSDEFLRTDARAHESSAGAEPAFHREAVSEFLRSAPIAQAGADALAPRADERAGFDQILGRVGDWFARTKQSIVESPHVGQIAITRSGIKASLQHGYGREKIAAFTLVPDVLRKGRLIDVTPRGRPGDDRATIAAPVRILGADYLMGVQVNRNRNGNRSFYLHEVTLTPKEDAGRLPIGAEAAPEGEATAGQTGAVERLLLAAHAGKFDHLFSLAAPTDTAAFKRWFGASRVIDANGRPRPVFHGTADDFHEFKDQHSGRMTGHMTAPLGHFFDESLAQARRYSEKAANGVPADQRVISAYLSIERPKVMSLDEFMAIDSQGQARTLRAKLEREGYDGIKLKLADRNQWVAFDSRNVKSTDNRGTFDRTNPDIRFSLDPKGSMEQLGDVLSKPDARTFDRAKEWLRGKAEDFRPAALGALSRRQLDELIDQHPATKGYGKAYDERVQQMEADRNQLMSGAPDAAEHPDNMLKRGAAAISDDLHKFTYEKGPAGWFGRERPEAKVLADVAHLSTIHGIDPSEPYSKLQMEDPSGKFLPWTPQMVKERIALIRDQMRGRPGDDKRAMMDEVKTLRTLKFREAARTRAYPSLVAAYEKLSPEGKTLFRQMRDWYGQVRDETEKALIGRVEAIGRDLAGTSGDDMRKRFLQQAVQRIRLQFEQNRQEGIYFPLNRDGDFWISFSDKNNAQGFKMFESAAEAAQAEKKLRAAGFRIEAQGRRDGNFSAKDAPSGSFVAGVIGILKKSGAPEKVQDDVYQAFLRSLPEMSMRKHAIHRKKVPGFSDDILRAFSKNAFHGAHQLARLRHAHELTAVLDAAKASMNNWRKADIGETSQSHTLDVARGDALLGELSKRHEFIMSPKDTQLANYANSIGFMYHLGASPASAITNLTQNAQVTLPVLAAQHGWDKATRVLGAAWRASARTGGNIDRTLTDPEERRAFNVLRARGDIDKTQTHSLAALSEGNRLKSNPAWSKTMAAMGHLFHKAEVINREAAGIAAYRLARGRGDDFGKSVQYASDIINGTHFDYSASNRPRYMQGNVPRIALQFKNYSQNMTWLMYRNLYQAFKGETPEVRRVAARTFAGVMGTTALMAGTMGLPMYNAVKYTAEAAHALFGDEEPFDFDTEYQNWLADNLGKDSAQLVARGGVNAATGANLATRVSLSNLWFQDADRELEGADAYHQYLEDIAGPIGGIAKNLFVGTKMIADGNVERGWETILPKFVKDSMKAMRFESEGANTARGDPIVPDITGPEAFVQGLGFTPTRLFEQQQENSALLNYEQQITSRRQRLMNAYVMAVQSGRDTETAMSKIYTFNQQYPAIAIRSNSIRESMRARAKYSAEAEGGIRLNRKLGPQLREMVGASEGAPAGE